MSAYYNEIDPYPAEWLENLSAAGHLPPGRVDTRSITDVHADDVRGAVQAHFFAGIGGWPLALRLAGWPDDLPVWTGSCPCQPFSVAGKGQGEADDRHLWPELRRLIAQCRPPVVFGEQVASAAGRAWLAAVRADLEGLDYAVGAADLCGASVGAPHIRQRLFWVAHHEDLGHQRSGEPWIRWDGLAHGSGAGRVADPGYQRGGRRTESSETARAEVADGSRVEHAEYEGSQGQCLARRLDSGRSEGWRSEQSTTASGYNDPWGDIEYRPCSDGKYRPTQPGLFPLAYGLSARVGRLRAYGNAIIPQVAAVFIRAYMIELGR